MKPVQRPGRRHEHEFEPQFGLPERLPAAEQLLWQGAPDWKTLARRAFHVRKLAVYFAVIIVLRVVLLIADGGGLRQVLLSLSWTVSLALLALGLIACLAWLAARATAYTITDRRVVMRIGIVLTVTFNLPFARIQAAGLHLDRDGSADLPLTLAPGDHIAWLQLWPHVRPWRLARPEPMLRSVPDGQRVAQILVQAWSASTGQSASSSAARGASATAPASSTQPAWAGR